MSATESEAKSPPTNEPAPGELQRMFASERLAWGLRVTLLVDGLAAITLAAWDFELTNGLLGQTFSALLLAMGLANLVALYSSLTQVSSWDQQSVVAQLLIAFLALYIGMTALSSMPLPWRGWLVADTAAVLGSIAIAWTLLLVRAARFQWSRTATVIAALLPLGGLVHFWYEADYLPKVTDPLIDVSTDLSPIGRAEGSTIRLAAKVTVHNRGQAKLYEAAGLIRVTAYANNAPPNTNPTPAEIEQAINFAEPSGNPFRPIPTPPKESGLLYAEDIARPVTSLAPDQTLIFQREVDLDSAKYRFARMSVRQIFFTDRPIRKYSSPEDPKTHRIEIDYDIGQESAMREILAGDWRLLVRLETNPTDTLEAPNLASRLCTAAQEAQGKDLWKDGCPRPEDVTRNNPLLWTFHSAEYGPTDHETNQR